MAVSSTDSKGSEDFSNNASTDDDDDVYRSRLNAGNDERRDEDHDDDIAKTDDDDPVEMEPTNIKGLGAERTGVVPGPSSSHDNPKIEDDNSKRNAINEKHEDDAMSRREKRLAMNRESARSRRKRKKILLGSLASEVHDLRQQVETYEENLTHLKQKNRELSGALDQAQEIISKLLAAKQGVSNGNTNIGIPGPQQVAISNVLRQQQPTLSPMSEAPAPATNFKPAISIPSLPKPQKNLLWTLLQQQQKLQLLQQSAPNGTDESSNTAAAPLSTALGAGSTTSSKPLPPPPPGVPPPVASNSNSTPTSTKALQEALKSLLKNFGGQHQNPDATSLGFLLALQQQQQAQAHHQAQQQAQQQQQQQNAQLQSQAKPSQIQQQLANLLQQILQKQQQDQKQSQIQQQQQPTTILQQLNQLQLQQVSAQAATQLNQQLQQSLSNTTVGENSTRESPTITPTATNNGNQNGNPIFPMTLQTGGGAIAAMPKLNDGSSLNRSISNSSSTTNMTSSSMPNGSTGGELFSLLAQHQATKPSQLQYRQQHQLDMQQRQLKALLSHQQKHPSLSL